MEKNRQSPHQASKMQLYSSYTELECIPILTCNLGLEIWSIHFKNQTHLEIVSWTRWRQHSYVLQISSFMANYTLYHKGPTSQDCLFFFFTGQPSHQIKLVCNQFFFFLHLYTYQQLQEQHFLPIKWGYISENTGPCSLTLPTSHFQTEPWEDSKRPQLPRSLIVPKEEQLFEEVHKKSSSSKVAKG